jgi:PAT family beta-lactamase induction signal transducer AmpG
MDQPDQSRRRVSEVTAPPKESWRESIARFSEPKMAMMLVLGFTAGLPFLLYFSTLSVWLERSDIDVALISFFSFFGLSYSFKFLWAPVLDRFDIPGFSKMFGRRRAWIFVAQLSVACAMVGIGIADPTKNLGATALFSFLLAFSSATQDIGIDAWRIEAAKDDDEQAPLAAAYQYGYKVGMIISGGVALVIAGVASFNLAYMVMAAIMATAALVFAVWDRPSGLKAAAAAGVALLAVGLFVGFSELTALFAEGSFSQNTFALLSVAFKVITALSALYFVYALFKAMTETASDLSFSFGAVIQGLGFSVAAIALVTAIAAGIGILIPLVLELLGITPSRGDVAKAAIYLAASPILVCALFIVPVRKLPANSPHLKHPAYGAFADFFWRHGHIALLILCFVSFYRLSDIVMGIMAKPAYSHMGYGPEQIGLASGIYGVWIVFVGVAAAGVSAISLGLKRSLIIGAIVSVLGNVVFAWMIQQSSDSLTPILIAITADNIAGGYAGTIFIAYMSSFVNKSFAGTQYAIFSSIYSLGPKLLAASSGYLVGQFSGGDEATTQGYSVFFLYAALLGIPAILLSCFTNSMKPDRKPPTS